MVFIYTTCPSARAAKKIGGELLKKRLVACYNFWPIRSSYRWYGKIMEEGEMAVLLKTTNKYSAGVKRLIEKMHPYDAPCIAVLSSRQLNTKYSKWLTGKTR